MLKSIDKIAEELNITKAAVYKKLKKKEYESLIEKENGKMMISEELLEKLKKSLNKKRKVEVIEDIEIINKKEIDIIENHLNKEDENKLLEILIKQIEEKDNQIKKLHGLIENNQVLIRNQQEKEKDQLKLEEHFKDIDRKLSEIRIAKKEKSKKGLFKLLKTNK